MSTEPPSPLSPESLPPQSTAASRLQALQAECAAAADSPIAAVAWHELGALYEHELQNSDEAQSCYRKAYRLDPTFAPSLMALERIYGGLPDYARLSAVLEARHSTADDPALRARVLAAHAVVLSDQLGEVERAEAQLESALDEDPSCQEAALMLEHQWMARGQTDEAALAVEARAAQVSDPALRATLLCEVAGAQARSGDRESAEAYLSQAVALAQGRFSALTLQHSLSLTHNDSAATARALRDMLALAEGFALGKDRVVEDDNAPLGRFQTAERARLACSALAHELYLVERYSLANPDAAIEALTRAVHYDAHPALLAEYAEYGAEQGDFDVVLKASALATAAGITGALQTRFSFRVAEAHLLRNEVDSACTLLERAYHSTPDCPALGAMLLRLLAVTGRYRDLVDHLEYRANRSQDDRARLLALATYAAAELRQDATATQRLSKEALQIAAPAEQLELARIVFVAGLKQGWAPLRELGLRLLAAGATDAEERTFFSVLAAYAGFKIARDAQGMRRVLPWLEDRDFGPYMLRVLAAAHDDMELLAQAHTALAQRMTEPAKQSAHLTCAARALCLAGRGRDAESLLQGALAVASDNAYAMSLLCLLYEQRGEDLSVVELLRDSARKHGDTRSAARQLLQAGYAAERGGDLGTALEHYNDAVTRDGELIAGHFARLNVAARLGAVGDYADALWSLASRGLFDNPHVDLTELAERMGEHSQADDYATSALELHDERVYAAVRLVACGRGDLNQAAQAVLAELVPEVDLRLDGTFRSHEQARGMSDGLSLALSALRTLSDPQMDGQRPAAFAALASQSERSADLSELQLLAIHSGLAQGGAEMAAEAVVAALSLLESARDQEATAIALDAAVGPSDSPELRTLALSTRLAFSKEDQTRSLRRELALAQLDSGAGEDALHAARQLTSEDRSDVLSLLLLRSAALQTEAFADLVLANDLLVEHAPKALGAELLVEAADCLRLELIDGMGAELRLRRALTLDPMSDAAFDRLHDLLLERGDAAGLLAVMEAHLSGQSGAKDVAMHYDAARLRSAAGSHHETIGHLRQVLRVEPLHVGALSLLAHAEHACGNARGAVAALLQLTQAELPSAQRRLVRLGAADFLIEPLGDYPGALSQLRALREEGLSTPEDLSRMAELASEAGQLDEAITSYRSAADQVHGARRCQWLRAAGRLLERRADGPGAAIATYREALAAVPTDRASHAALYRLLPTPAERLREALQFLASVQARLAERPLDADLLRGMRVAGHHSAMSFVEFAALDTLSSLGLSDHAEETARQLLAHQRETNRKRQAMSDEGLSLLRAAADQGPLHQLAVTCSEALAGVLPDARKPLGRRQRNEPSPHRSGLVSELAVFGLTARHLYVVQDPRRTLQLFETGEVRTVDVVVSDTLLHPLRPRDRFSLGMQSCAQRLGTLRLEGITPGMRRTALLALVIAAELFPVAGAPDDARALARELNRHLSRRQRRELKEMSADLQRDWARLDTYLAAAEMTRLRAGLIQCGTLGPALAAAGAAPGKATSTPEALSLLRFWTSSKATVLHGEGVQVSQGRPGVS